MRYGMQLSCLGDVDTGGLLVDRLADRTNPLRSGDKYRCSCTLTQLDSL